jgi:hypothetical protein
MEAQMFRMNPKRENGDPPFLGSSGLSVLMKKNISSCTKQIVNVEENAGLQSVINTIHADKHRHHTSHFVGLYFIDTQDPSSYTSTVIKQCLIGPRGSSIILIHLQEKKRQYGER